MGVGGLLGGKKDGGCPGGRERLPPLWLAGGPLWFFLRPIFFIYSKNMLDEFSRLLELSRIGL